MENQGVSVSPIDEGSHAQVTAGDAVIPPNRPRATIDILPEEILLCIFKVLVEPDPLAAGRLLGVSKDWRYLVRMTPSLWSQIQVVPRKPSDITSYIQYIETAYAYSANLPLHITISLPPSAYVRPDGSREPSSWLNSARVALEPLPPDIERLKQAIIGHDGANALRWRSLRLRMKQSLGTDRIMRAFMAEFKYPTPNLESLSLHLWGVDPYFRPNKGPLPDLGSLRCLTVDAGGHLGYIKFAPAMIHTLCFRLWRSTNVLFPFINLRNLSIVSWLNTNSSYDDDPVITFPFLDCLTLQWSTHESKESTAALPYKIRAPSLTTLRLLDGLSMAIVAEAGEFLHIRALDLLVPSSDMVASFLDLHLHKYSALVTLAVCPWHLELAKTGLHARRLVGEAPVGLNVLYSVYADKEGVELEKGNISEVIAPWRLPNDFVYREHGLSMSTHNVQ